MERKKFFIDSDDDGHKYLIPAEKRQEWEGWLKRFYWENSEEEMPTFVFPIGCHPNKIEFYME